MASNLSARNPLAPGASSSTNPATIPAQGTLVTKGSHNDMLMIKGTPSGNNTAATTPPHHAPPAAAVTSLSLQAIIVVACGVFAFVTSFVSFYLQYDFFLGEYSSQMEGRVGYYSEMFGNQINVKSNSNSSSIAHITTTAVFDAYDGIASTDPNVSDLKTFQWYILQSYTMFAAGLTLRYTFPTSGTTLSLDSYSLTVDICSDTSGGAGVFTKVTYVIDATLAPWISITAPVPCTDGRLDPDVATVMTNASAYAVPRLGASIPFDYFYYTGVSINTTTKAPMFIMSVVMKAAAVLEWGSVAPSVEAYYFDDNGAFVGTSRTDIATNINTTIRNFNVPYLQAVVVPKLDAVGFLGPNPTSLRGQFFEYEYDGFAWGYHELPMPTLSGRPWRIVLIDTTHTDLTGSTPKRTGALIIAGGTVAALVLCALIFHVWFAPLSDLAARVRSSSGVGGANASVIGLDGHMDDATKSGEDKKAQQANADILSKPMAFTVFTEIARAQEAFLNVQESLQEIQSYIPQSLQHHPGDAAEGISGPMMMVDNIAVIAGGGSTEDGGTQDPTTNPTTPAGTQEEAIRVANAEERNTNGDLNTSNNNLVERIGGVDGGSFAGDAAAADAPAPAGHPGANLSSLVRNPVDTALPAATGINSNSRPASAAAPPSGGSRPGSSAMHHNPNALGIVGDNPQGGNMLPCRMTTLHLRLHRFAKWTVAVPFLEMAATCICQHNGVLDTVDYGSITATFNCHRQCPTHEKNAVDAALEIKRAARRDPKFQAIMAESPFSIGIDTDIAVALTVGFEDIKARVVIGPGFELARKLSTLAYDIANADILVTGPVAVATTSVPSLIVDYIQPRRDHIQMLAGAAGAGGGGAVSSRSEGSTGDGKSVHEIVGMYASGSSATGGNNSGQNSNRAPSRQSETSATIVQDIVSSGLQEQMESYRIAFASMRQGNYEDAAERFTTLIVQLDAALVDAPPLGVTPSRNHGTATTADVVSRAASGPPRAASQSSAVGGGQGTGASNATHAMLDVEVQHAMLKQSKRLLNICSNRKDGSGGPSERYIRAERCPWDVLPVERELCAETADGGLPAFLFQNPTGQPGANGAPGGGTSSRRAGDSMVTGSVAPDPTLIAGNASFGTEWSRSQLEN